VFPASGITTVDQTCTDRYSGVPAEVFREVDFCEARGRSPGEIPARCWLQALEGRKPKGASSGGRVKPRLSPGTLARVKSQEPRPVGPALPPWRTGIPMGETVRGFTDRGNATGTLQEEKAPKGESQERRRRETKPARARRE
jgi:hypothetical protein